MYAATLQFARHHKDGYHDERQSDYDGIGKACQIVADIEEERRGDEDTRHDGKEQRQTVDKFTKIAIKKAELKRLTKAERQAANIYAYSDLSVFLSAFIIMGGLFGIFMTLGFMLIEVAVTAIVGLANQIPELFMTTPWWLIFAACWVMFGGAMGVVQIIGKRK